MELGILCEERNILRGGSRHAMWCVGSDSAHGHGTNQRGHLLASDQWPRRAPPFVSCFFVSSVDTHIPTQIYQTTTLTNNTTELAFAWTPSGGTAPTGGLNSYTYAVKMGFDYLNPWLWTFAVNGGTYWNECMYWTSLNLTCIVGKFNNDPLPPTLLTAGK